MKRLIALPLILAAGPQSAMPQTADSIAEMHATSPVSARLITGTVTDSAGEPVTGAVISVDGKPGVSAMADIDGAFSIKI
ncbi:MAG: carboxypeptidase-like regulatory domain-containing protein, partial [Muribaculaceae bacterium]|nr:carboxypeptidase-like regulatory domain-containing protein [Muribaculaceae bacterium]